jgi:hypothetical protein
MKKIISIIAGLFLISTLSACSSLLADADSCPEGYYKSNGGKCLEWGLDEWVADEPVDTSWIPSDFNSYSGNDNIAWKWADAVGGGYDCEYGDSCWALLVITRDGCPNGMYAELAIFDRNDIQIDYANDLTTYVSPKQKVRLGFDTFNDNARTASVAEINCR